MNTETVFFNEVYNLSPFFFTPGYHSYVDDVLPPESPYLYGLHPNAEIDFLTTTSDNLFRTILELMPKDAGGAGSGGGPSREEKVRFISFVYFYLFFVSLVVFCIMFSLFFNLAYLYLNLTELNYCYFNLYLPEINLS